MERILIARMSALGDIVHSLPAVAALRRAFPQAKIGWIVEERWAQALAAAPGSEPRSAAQPLVDVVHRLDTRAWRASPLAPGTRREMKTLVAALRQQQYELAVDLQAAVRSALVNWLSRSPERVGFAAPRERLARLFYTRAVATPAAHVVDQGLELANAISPRADLRAEFPLPRDEQAARWAEEQFSHSGAGNGVVIIAPAAGWGAKCWPAERFGEVAAALAQQGFCVLVNAGPGETELARRVVESSGGLEGGRVRAVESSLSELLALIGRAELFIGGDTGPLHLAAASGRPVLALYGPTDPARNGPYAPNGERSRVRVLRNPLSRTSHARRSASEAGLMQITVAEVVEAARELLRSTA